MMAEDFEMIDLSEEEDSLEFSDSGTKDDKLHMYWNGLTFKKKIMFFIAAVLTFSLITGIPAYGWMHWQRQIARFERISTPNSLYITAARREDSKYFEVDNIDVSAYWYDNGGLPVSRATYQDYVFAVVGDYVTSYTLQLAHTTNNNYTYEIFEAEVTDTDPSGSGKILGRDYIEYTLTKDYDPAVMVEVTDNPLYADKEAGNKLYYSVKQDSTGNNISLNGSYLNQVSQFAAEAEGPYHTATYGERTTGDGSGTGVQTHAEPLYWQAKGIQVDGSGPFCHEYILRISWTNGEGSMAATTTYKDTDMIYITAKVD